MSNHILIACQSPLPNEPRVPNGTVRLIRSVFRRSGPGGDDPDGGAGGVTGMAQPEQRSWSMSRSVCMLIWSSVAYRGEIGERSSPPPSVR